MKYILFAVFLFNIFVFSQNTDEQKTSKKWYVETVKKIKIKLNRVINPQKSTNVSSVFGVRGNKYDSKNGIYWKAKNSDKLDEKIKKDKETLDIIFKKIEESNTDEAIAELEKFIKNNPNSYFKDEVDDLLKNLKSEKEIKTQSFTESSAQNI